MIPKRKPRKLGKRKQTNLYDKCPKCGEDKVKISSLCRSCRIQEGRVPIDDTVYVIDGNPCRKIPLTLGQYAIVDKKNYASLMQWTWTAVKHRNTYYAQRKEKTGINQWITIHMHRVVLGYKETDPQVDHHNRNGMDNRETNLRPGTDTQQRANQKVRSDNKIGYKGVARVAGSKSFRAYISIGGKLTHLGCFPTVEEAARAYDAAAKLAFGKYAKFNFPEG